MKSKILVATIGAACFSVLLAGCSGDKDEATTPYSTTSESEPYSTTAEPEKSGSMKDSAGSAMDSTKEMGDDAATSMKDTSSDAVDGAKKMKDDAMNLGRDKMSGGDANMDAETEMNSAGSKMDKMKDDAGKKMDEGLNKRP